jgi:hypothetical protein
MPHSQGSSSATMERRTSEPRFSLGGVPVREHDIEETRSIRFIAFLFRGMAVMLLVLTAAQIVFGLTSTVPLSPGVLFADAVRLIIFAGLLWGAGELAILWVKSHYDIRAQRILTARIAHLLQQEVDDRHDGAA